MLRVAEDDEREFVYTKLRTAFSAGSIAVLHDRSPLSEPDRRQPLQRLDIMLLRCHCMGLKAVTVSELLATAPAGLARHPCDYRRRRSKETLMRTTSRCIAGLLGMLLSSASVTANTPSRTLVLPLRSTGVNDTTLTVCRQLLIGSLQHLGVPVGDTLEDEASLPAGAAACAEPACASRVGREHHAGQVVYGSLARLGSKIIARVDVIRAGEDAPYYRDQLVATSQEDLDHVMRRFAEGIAAGRPNSDRATVESVTNVETLTPLRRAARTGFGLRAGFLFPVGGSYGGADRLTHLRGVYKYEMRDYQIETTTLCGFSWGQDQFEWTILDLGVSRLFSTRDFAPFAGASVGVHSVTLQDRHPAIVSTPYYYYYNTHRQTRTAPALDVFAGLLAMRTYDFHPVVELRLHFVLENFPDVNGKGANGVMLSFGTSH